MIFHKSSIIRQSFFSWHGLLSHASMFLCALAGPGPFDFLQSDQGGNLLHIHRGHLIAHGPG